MVIFIKHFIQSSNSLVVYYMMNLMSENTDHGHLYSSPVLLVTYHNVHAKQQYVHFKAKNCQLMIYSCPIHRN